jgi:hypothetical protein
MTPAETLSHCAMVIGKAMQPAFEAAGRAMGQFYESVIATAERQYLAEFGRLPGSTRTARLRKKRRKRVMDWFMERLQERAVA